MHRVKRSDVPLQETWDLTDLFESHAAWEAELDAIRAALPSVTKYHGQLAEGAEGLAACLEAREALQIRMNRVASYATFRLSTDSLEPNHQADTARVATLDTEFSTKTAFIQSEVLALPDGTVESWMAGDATLHAFRHTLRNWLEIRPYRLTAEVESALLGLSQTLSAPQRIYTLSKGADMRFDQALDKDGQAHPVHDGGSQLSPDPILRRNAYASFTQGLRAYRTTYAATFATEVEKNVTLAKMRGYDSATQMLLHPHKVEESVYHSIHDVIRTELAPHMRRYQRMRQRLLGLDNMLYCDLTVQLPDGPTVTYEQGRMWILDALQVLGEEYHEIIRRAFSERWIDRSDNLGKRSGAFCNTVYGVHSYVFMTWENHTRAVFTLAHELGHAGHLSLAAKYQKQSNSRPPMSFIESPSTMNELLLAQHLLKQSDDKRMRRSVIAGLMGTYHHNFVNHLLEGELQRRMYQIAEKRTPITEQTLTRVKGEILAEFWGDTVEIDEGAALTWMRQPHYYMGLYPYTYALGLSISTAAAQAIESQGEPAIKRWIDVLKAGGTKTPAELAGMAGADITNPDVIRSAVAYVGTLVDAFEATLDEYRDKPAVQGGEG
ncbi:oligoendopeptidase F [Ferroacidibacillus organovorans]|uniref:Oligopeptidase F n=1 Tax=Ferroacidibacillus organovorans TaxID=1765683 RepID=A0A1V4ER03_9BACL|nr:oligoendopeptidase F [Ferroacidibacillus organovorans]OPG15365.1 oligoendopeptidase F [Ferroacidibacillus organovorans]